MRILCFLHVFFCAFVTPAISASLPSGYTELEYIEKANRQGQFIDTGIKLNNNSAIEIKYNQVVNAGSAMFGTSPYMEFRENNNGIIKAIRYNSTMYNTNYSATDINTIKLDKNIVYVNRVLAHTFAAATFTTDVNAYLFKRNVSDANAVQEAAGKIYYCKIWNNGSLVRNFIPAKRNSDNTLGMYDTAWDGSQYGVIDLGDLNWGYLAKSSSYPYGLFYASVSSKANGEWNLYINSNKYTVKFYQQDKACFGNPQNGMVYISDSNYTDTTLLKASLKGTKLYYQRTTDSEFHGPFYTNSGTGVFTGGPEIGIKVATTAYVEESFKDSVDELNNTIGTIKNVVDNTIIQADRIGKLHTGKQNRPAENCPDGAQCLLITEADGSLHWYPICDENGNIGTQSSN